MDYNKYNSDRQKERKKRKETSQKISQHKNITKPRSDEVFFISKKERKKPIMTLKLQNKIIHCEYIYLL